jgi:hypothetical protein
MKTRIMLISCVIGIMCIGGCTKTLEQPVTMSDVQVITTYDPQAAFPKSASYAFLRMRPEQEAGSDAEEVIVRRLRDAIKGELASKRYKPAKGEIDYIVDYQLVAQYSMSVLAERTQQEGQDWLTIVGVPDDFVQGALVIDVIDVATLKPVWRGLCNANIALADVTDEERNQRARYAVQELLKTFPPK